MEIKKLPHRELLLMLLLGVLLCGIGIFTLIRRFEYIEVNASDLYNDYIASKLLLNHQSIYSDLLNPNNHPPFVILLTLPLTVFPYRSSITIWNLVTIILYLFSGYLIYKELRLRVPKSYFPAIIGFALCWYPFQAHIALGQWSIQIGVCIILGWLCLHRKKDYLAGFLFGFACLIKLYPGFIILYLLVYKRWRTIFTMLFTIVFGLTISALVIPTNDIVLYFTSIISKNTVEFMVFPINYSILGILGKFFYNGGWVQPIFPSPVPITTVAIILDIVLVIFLVGFLCKKPSNQFQMDVNFAMCILAMLFISPISWQHLLPMLFLPFGLIISKLQNKYDRYQFLLLILALSLLSIPEVQITRFLMERFSPYRIPWYIATIFLSIDAGLVIIGMLLNIIRRQDRLDDQERLSSLDIQYDTPAPCSLK